MDKLKKILLGLLGVSLGLLLVFQLYEALTLDSTVPVITCPQEALETSVSAAEKDLLAEVSAQDDKDGDLTAAVVVEHLSTMAGDGTRQITYAVMDRSGNVGRATRSLHYTDYAVPHIYSDAPLRAERREQLYPLLEELRADSVLDGDLSSKVKYSFLGSTAVSMEGFYPIELRVDDSAGNSMVISTQAEIYNSHEETIQVKLTDYILYLHTGDPFDPAGYYQSASQPGKLTMDSNVDTSTPGVYHVTYTVTDESTHDFGISRLIVVVEA